VIATENAVTKRTRLIAGGTRPEESLYSYRSSCYSAAGILPAGKVNRSLRWISLAVFAYGPTGFSFDIAGLNPGNFDLGGDPFGYFSVTLKLLGAYEHAIVGLKTGVSFWHRISPLSDEEIDFSAGAGTRPVGPAESSAFIKRKARGKPPGKSSRIGAVFARILPELFTEARRRGVF
jgi:hypothetical protein